MLSQPVDAPNEDALTSILTTTLEARGVLGKIRAELRASVFTAIHEHQVAAGIGGPAGLAQLHQDSAGQLAAQLVLELLEACQLDYSLSVLAPEANLKGVTPNRSAIAGALGLEARASNEPLLIQLVRAALPGGGGLSAPPATAAVMPATTLPAAATSCISAAPVAATNLSSASSKPSAGESVASSNAPLAAQPVGKESGGASKPLGVPSSSGACHATAASAGGDSPPKDSPLRSAGAPPSPPSPASPLLSNLPPLGKPKGPIGGGFLADLPPLSGRGATVPPLTGPPAKASGGGGQGIGGLGGLGGSGLGNVGGGGGGGGGGEGGGTPEGEHEERRLDALESKLSTLAGLPPRAGGGSSGALGGSSGALAPIGGAASRLSPGRGGGELGSGAFEIRGGAGGMGGGSGTSAADYDDEEVRYREIPRLVLWLARRDALVVACALLLCGLAMRSQLRASCGSDDRTSELTSICHICPLRCSMRAVCHCVSHTCMCKCCHAPCRHVSRWSRMTSWRSRLRTTTTSPSHSTPAAPPLS